ncbi:hypothetical protein BH11PSE11_BH11PSE11_03710 [soil metagenome]
MLERLRIALDALNYESSTDLHYQSNLIHAIQIFALVQRDVDLEIACDAELEHIRQQVVKRQAGKPPGKK